MKEYYELLNLREGANLSDIKKASRKLLLKYHPDLNPAQKDWALEKTKRILLAYEVLTKKNFRQDIVFKTTEELRKNTSPAASPRIAAYMFFQIGLLQFAIPVEYVSSITALSMLKVTRITPNKGLYPFIIGVINNRGNILPLLDLRNKLQLDDRKQIDSHVVICRIEAQQLGLVIDKGTGVSYVKDSELITEPAAMQSDVGEQYVSAIFSKHGQKIHVLNLESIISY